MKKKGKMRQFPGPRGPQMLSQPGVPGGPGGPVVKQKISEIDFYKYRLAVQKEATVLAKQETINNYKVLLAKEEENIRLRISLLRMENMRDIGHLNLGQGDQVAQEGEEFYVVRAPRQGPVPPVNGVVPPAPAAPVTPPPEVPPAGDLPPVPSADPEEGDETEEEPTDGDEE